MGRTFRDAIAADARQVFLNTNEMAVEIVYERSAVRVELAAIPEEPLQQRDGDEAATNVEYRDFLVDPDLIDFGSGPVRPGKGDLIHEGLRSFEVMARQDAPVWEWDDEYRTLLRIHTVCTKDA